MGQVQALYSVAQLYYRCIIHVLHGNILQHQYTVDTSNCKKITFRLEFTDIWQGFEAGEIIKTAVLKYETTVFLSIEIIRFSVPTPAIKILLEYTTT